MLRLTTLGAIRLTGLAETSSPPPLLSQPKRLALLVYLALARPGTLVFRDTLVALLWPDYGTVRARRALRQTLHHLRHELGPKLIVGSHSESIGLDADALWCDAVELERAAQQDRPERVLELYAGEFLPGFHPACGPELERWLDEERQRLRQKATCAAATLVQRAELGGDEARAVEHARRLVELLPYDEPAARVLIRLLARGGNRAGAVAAYDALAARLRAQLELTPDARTRSLLAAVRAGDPAALEGTADRIPAAWCVPAERTYDGNVRALAVLPFAALTGSATEHVLAEGLGEMLITELGRNGCVPVVSRTSVQPYRDAVRSLAAVARELGVELLVEGTVLESGGRLRVTVQLLTVGPERHLWADSYECEEGDPLALQARLAATIAERIEATLTLGGAEHDGVTAGAAREAYFQGRCHFARMTAADFTEALRLFQEATRADPRFARAHAALGSAMGALARTGRAAPRPAFGEARRRAERALALDPRLPEAHVVLGTCATFLDRDWERAEWHMRRGLELGPDLPDSWWAYSNLLLITARHDEARRAARRARELDPVLPTLWLNEVLVLTGSGEIADADVAAAQFAAFHRDNSATAFALGMVREAQHEHAAAVAHFAHAEELGGGPHTLAALGHNLACLGRTDHARHQLERLLSTPDRYLPASSVARIHAALGDPDTAFEWLDRAELEHDDWLLYIDAWPRFENLRAAPRFDALRQQLRLPQTVRA